MKTTGQNRLIYLLLVALLVANFSFVYADSAVAQPLEQGGHNYGTANRFETGFDHLNVHINYPQTDYDNLNVAISGWIRSTIEQYKTAGNGAGALFVDYDANLVAEKYISVKLFARYKDETGRVSDSQVNFNLYRDSSKLLSINDLFNDAQLVDLKARLAYASGIEARYFETNSLDCWQLTDRAFELDLLADDYSPLIKEDFHFTLPYGNLFDLAAITERLNQHPSTWLATSDIVNLKSDKKIALTFDDGPGPYTERLLDILQKHGARATFFVVGKRVGGRQETVARMPKQYCEVANHTWSHPALTKISNARVESELKATSDAILAATGSGAAMSRAPYGALNGRVKALTYQLGYYFISWSIDPKDWLTKNADKTYNHVINRVSDGQIILLHDIHKQSVDAAERLIPKLIEQGYELVTVSELLGQGGVVPQGGKVYNKR